MSRKNALDEVAYSSVETGKVNYVSVNLLDTLLHRLLSDFDTLTAPRITP